jgi:hypothetical protein
MILRMCDYERRRTYAPPAPGWSAVVIILPVVRRERLEAYAFSKSLEVGSISGVYLDELVPADVVI